MNKKVYISRLSSFLPNAPVDNDEMENILGYVGGHPSRIELFLACSYWDGILIFRCHYLNHQNPNDKAL